jgi:V/A-type H+-transporting ATPase subunit I
MMVGDVGYGVLMFVIAMLFVKKVKKGLIADFLGALKIGSLWAILFGVLYGEYFGNLGENLGISPLWISRSEASSFTTLLMMAIAVGVVHIMLGLLIGVWNSVVQKSRSHFMERGGTFIALVGVLVLAAALTNRIPNGYSTLGWIVLAVGLVFMGLSMGKTGVIMGPIEFVGVIGNVLSYLRIAALGLASVFLAKVANDMVGMVGSIVAGAIIAILIHALNLVMGMFSPTIQSLRLQYVEFFRKFYEGGQSSFTPFRRRIDGEIMQNQIKS